MSLLMFSFLFIAALSGVICDKPDAETVKKIIASSNRLFKEKNLTEMSLLDFMIEPIRFDKGSLTSLDTMELQDVGIVENQEEGGVRYDFKLKLGLKELTIKYRYEIVLPIVHPKGIFSTKVGKNTLYAYGHVSVKNDGSCSAVWKDAYVNALDDYEVHLNPKDVKNPALGYLEGVINKEIGAVISMNIQAVERSDSFKENFNNLVCSELQKN